MTVPAGGEIAVYNSAVKTQQARVAVGLDYPLWDADKSDTFGSALDPVDWWYTQYGSSSPLVSGGDLLLRAYGGPPREVVISRPHWMPSDPNQAFKIAFNATFPLTDPKYPMMITIGGVQDGNRITVDPLTLMQPGTNDFSNVYASVADLDHIHYSPPLIRPPNNFDGAQASVLYELEYDPLKAVNANILRFLVNSAEIWARDSALVGDAEGGLQPRYIAFGYAWPPRNDRGTNTPGAVLGSEDTPVTLLQVHDFAVTQLGAEGHETRSYPGWTSANAGGTTIEDSAEGERFEEDGETWALIPINQVDQISVSRARAASSDSFRVQLFGPDQTDPDTLTNIFVGDRMQGRSMLIDTRIGDGASSETFTAWKRQMAGVIETHDVAGGAGVVPTIELGGRDLPTSKFDTFIDRSYIEGAAVEAVQATNVGYSVRAIVEDLAEVADIVAGGVLGATDRDINMPFIRPTGLSSVGQSLLSVATELIDVLADESYRRFTISGDGRYGRFEVNAWTHGTGSAGYTFSSEGASTARDGRTVVGARLLLTSRDGVGQVQYHQDHPNIDPSMLQSTWTGMPGLGNYPARPWPPDARISHQSLGWAGRIALGELQESFDQSDAAVKGGFPRLRYARENAGRRRLVMVVSGHDWLEPAVDEIALDDPDFTGVATTETWIVDAVQLTWRGGELLTEVTAVTQDWVEAIRTGM